MESTENEKRSRLFAYPNNPTPKEQRFKQIVPNVFLSSLVASQNEDFLQDHEITHILHVGTGKYSGYKNNYVEHSIAMPDDDMPLDKFRAFVMESNQFISNAVNNDGKVLIHCLMGSSRSPTILGAYLYLTKQLQLSLLDTFLFVKEKAPWIWPPEDMFHQILEIEKTL